MFMYSAYTCLWYMWHGTASVEDYLQPSILLPPQNLICWCSNIWRPKTLTARLTLTHFFCNFNKIPGDLHFKNLQLSVKKWLTLSPFPHHGHVCSWALPCQAFSEDFQDQQLWAKKQKQNPLISPWKWMKITDKIKYNCKGDIGEELRWVYKESHTGWLCQGHSTLTISHWKSDQYLDS